MALIVECRHCSKVVKKGLDACPGCGGADFRFTVDYWPRGRNGSRKRITLPVEVTSRDQALDIERSVREAKKPRKKIDIASRAATVSDLFPDYLSWYRQHRSVTTWHDVNGTWERDLRGTFGDQLITSITNAHFSLYQKMRGSKVSNRTINKELDYFSGFLRWCRREKKIDLDRIDYEKLPYSRPLPIVLSPGEVGRILEAAVAEPVYYALFCCLYTLGLRIAEARGLRIAEVDFENRSIRVLQKGGKQKILPVNDRVIEAIEAVIAWRKEKIITGKGWKPSAYVFSIARSGEPIKNVRKAIERICARANVTKYVHPHLFRHSIATHMLGANVNLRTIQQYLGHTQIDTTAKIYTHVVLANLRDAQDIPGLYGKNE